MSKHCIHDQEQVCEVVEGLNIYLANLNILFVKLHNMHWNVVGIGFFDLHEQTQILYEAIADKFDAVAERIKMLGYQPLASTQDYLEVATIRELPNTNLSSQRVAEIIIDDFCCMVSLLKKIKNMIKDANDDCGLLGEGICFFEKYIWFFNAYLTRC
ncbi:Dps family protein [Pelosinus baikalensis]|uniref:DNA starvation/stationary phase protection protein n=1 Tax=Pelosinus baikalensis TaxID=2892015 RepID=A0ABS8HU43_9FIRM|nr:DNA starvation/stationary phase protection protein [Pelosinus baikalensis]MCC5466678.1 DNA starvation/stationary phase protection protein [Pelosinus baikalensis]